MTIIVPYRDRPHQLPIFVKHMSAYLTGADIVVVEQADNKPFNRAKLINAGFAETKPEFFVAHDIDMLALAVDYTPTKGVTQLAGNEIQKTGYLGGVTMFDAVTFRKAGGYNNSYYHRAEDNEMAFQLARLGIKPAERFGVFDLQPHPRRGPEFIPALWAKSKQARWEWNQIDTCKYEIISREETNYLHLKIKL